VDIHAYAVMHNHFRLVVYFDPSANLEWTREQVVQRWMIASPPRKSISTDPDKLAAYTQALLSDSAKIEKIREQLGSLSMFMKYLKQPIARRANVEDRCTGHFFEQRFYSGALLNRQAVLAAMAYVDMNPIRAKMAQALHDYPFTSIAKRLKSSEFGHQISNDTMAPVISGLRATQPVEISLSNYVEHLEQLIVPENSSPPKSGWQRWRQQVALLGRKQRAFGGVVELRDWLEQRGMHQREMPFS